MSLLRRIGARFARSETSDRVARVGQLGPVPRKPSWPLTEPIGAAAPDGVQHLLGRSDWDPDAVRDAVRDSVVETRGDPDAVRILDEIGFLTTGTHAPTGTHAAGVARQDTGTAGRLAHAPVGVFLASARGHGTARRSSTGRWTGLGSGPTTLAGARRGAAPRRRPAPPHPSWPRRCAGGRSRPGSPAPRSTAAPAAGGGSGMARGGHDAGRVALQVRQVRVLEPGPDLRLPGPVGALDHRREPRLTGRDDDRDDPQAQAQPRDPAEGVGVGMWPLKDRVVVELAGARQPDSLPKLDQAVDHESGGDARLPRPRGRRAARCR
jgi:hypothetical protein